MDVINNTKEFSNSTPENELSGIDVAQLVGKLLWCIFCVIGFVSNITLIRIYKKKDLSVRFNSLMLILAIIDLATIILYILNGTVNFEWQLFTVRHYLGLGPEFCAVLLYLNVVLINSSAYTMAAIALDRYLICRNQTLNQSKLPILSTILKITVMSMTLMAPYCMWNQESFLYFAITRSWQFFIQAGIPCTVMLFFNIVLYKKLRLWKASNELDNKNNVLLRKSVLKIRLALTISSIFVMSQIIVWAPMPFEVCYIHSLYFEFKSSTSEI